METILAIHGKETPVGVALTIAGRRPYELGAALEREGITVRMGNKLTRIVLLS